MKKSKSILVTGGAGFIGAFLVKRLLKNYPNYQVLNLDLLTYASNLSNLKSCESFSNYKFLKGDIRDFKFLEELFSSNNFDIIIHLAAESHVDNSIKNPFPFVLTNVQGTLNLLEATRLQWGNNIEDKLFYHVSTDEVFGTLGVDGKFTEMSPYDPRSPYSASKAASDHLVRAYYHTYNLPILLSNCSNNYGPAQHFEKLIPLIIQNIVNKKSLPVYGDGKQVRDWIHVSDHVRGVFCAMDGLVSRTFESGEVLSRTCEPFSILTLSLPDKQNTDIFECLDLYGSDEEMKGENATLEGQFVQANIALTPWTCVAAVKRARLLNA